MARADGNLTGLKPNQITKLNNLFRRRFEPALVVRREQARDLAELTLDIARQIGLLLDRKGRVMRVVVGDAKGVRPPDFTRLRGGGARLAGFSFLRTHLGPAEMSGDDRHNLAHQRWDYLAILEVDDEGLPGGVLVAHLLPNPTEDEDFRILPMFAPGRPHQPMDQLVRSLEEEFGRVAGAEEVGESGKAILISITTGSKAEAADRLDELAELAKSAGLSVAGRVVQRLPKLNPKTLMGPGKLNEVLMIALRQGADVLVVDQNLNPSQAHALARATASDLKVIDRTQLILDIFAQRATTAEGKLQVEMAQLKYLMPRLSGRDDGLSRLTGGIGGRGPGETRLEIDRRRVRQRVTKLKKELDAIAGRRSRRRSRRQSLGLPVLSIVGYTNAGKSTLLNALTNSEVLVENRLFATLDPTTRRLRFPQEREVIITDTVGFIRDLPPDLAQAFAATLEELSEADLLLHLADVSHPQVNEQIEAVDRILDDLELGDTPRLVVLNKLDRANPEAARNLADRLEATLISALDKKTLQPLLTRVEGMLFRPGELTEPPRYEQWTEEAEADEDVPA